MRAQITNRIKKLEEDILAKESTLRMANQKYLELNHAHTVLANSAVSRLRGLRLRLYVSVGLNIGLIALSIYLVIRSMK